MLNKLFLAALVTLTLSAQTKWEIDKGHSNVLFTVTHLIVSEVVGNFKEFAGTFNYTKADFSDATAEFSIDVHSINTDIEKRDAHLKSDDFFNAEKFPKIVFKSKSFKKTGDKSYKITGDLTIRDVTKSVDFDATFGGEVKDPWGNTKSGWKAATTINRLDYKLKWNSLLEAGGAVVGPEVQITFNGEFLKK